MKKFFKGRLFSFIMGFIFGAGMLSFVHEFTSSRPSDEIIFKPDTLQPNPQITDKDEDIEDDESVLDDMFDDDFFSKSDNPFEDMRKMREQIMKKILRGQDGLDEDVDGFDNWFTKRFGGGTLNDIQQKDDGKFITVEIKVGNVEGSKLNVQVREGYIHIEGGTESGSGSGSTGSGGFTTHSRSTFKRMIPVPHGVDPEKMVLEKKKDALVLKFPKSR